MKNRKHSQESKEKIRNTLKGHTPWNKGKKGCQTPWNKGKKGCQTAWNKGKKMSEESRKKMSETRKGKEPWNKGKSGLKWWNNGIINKMSKECPGECFVRGKLKSK